MCWGSRRSLGTSELRARHMWLNSASGYTDEAILKVKILYVDMDNVLVDFSSGVAKLPQAVVQRYERCLDEVPGIFALMDPIPGAVESFEKLASLYDTYVLSTSPWKNPSAWSDKLIWVKKYLGAHAYKRLILTHHKNLNVGDYLIDDRPNTFLGELVLFGSERFPNWEAVVAYLVSRAG